MRLFLRITVLLSIVGIGYSLFHIYSYSKEYKVAEAKYDQLNTIYAESESDSFDVFHSENEDYVGWLSMDGTNIAYPVVQSDNNDFYLNHNFYQENDPVGAIFMDYRNSNDALDDHTIIYGHNMKDDSMFATLSNALESDFSDNNRIHFDFENGSSEWEVFSAYVTTDTDWMQVDFESTDHSRNFKQTLVHNSTKDFAHHMNNEKILTLATCTVHSSDERVVVHAKKVEGN